MKEKAKMFEDFSNPCNPSTLHRILDNLTFYSKKENYDPDAIRLFTSLEEKARSQCKLYMREINGYHEKKQTLRTMRGFSEYEIVNCEDGSLSLRALQLAPTPKSLESQIPHEKLLFESRNLTRIKERKEK
jgi:hypothetical protein